MYSDVTYTSVVLSRKVCTISSYFLKYVLIKFVYNYGLRGDLNILWGDFFLYIWFEFYVKMKSICSRIRKFRQKIYKFH
jgi:hypothetical protein